MKPAAFDYKRPDSLKDAIAMLSDAGPAGRVIAGSGELAEELGAPRRLIATNVCGVSSQQGISRLRAMVH